MPDSLTDVRGNITNVQILEATLRLIGDHGLQAVTHRAVAQAAGVSTGAIAYHFASRDALLEAALTFAGQREVDALERLALDLQAHLFDTDAWVEQLSSVLAGRIEADRAGQIALYELLLASARSPSRRAVMEQWNDAFLGLAELAFRARASSDPPLHARILVATISGAMLKQLAYPVERFEIDALRPLLRELIGRLVD